jgi:diguanylate cyclase (GGDEF)-like protein
MADWIVVVDDDSTNLKMAGHILSKHNKRVTAMTSGYALLDYIKGNIPDIILLDIKMPDMDGFETLRKLRALEKELNINEIPVIFLTANEDVSTEMRGFEVGVSDYVRKPFDPEILVKRIDNIIGKQEQILKFQEEATIDQLTGLLNKAATKDKMTGICGRMSGYLMIIDLDSFKLVNDIYGHSMGDEVLKSFADILRKCFSEDCVIGRIGGDEFLAFSPEIDSEDDLKPLTERLNASMTEKAKQLMGQDMTIPLGVSMGAAFISGKNSDYEELFKAADKALYNVKQNGKHGCAVYSAESEYEDEVIMNLKTISMILSERNIPDRALQLDRESFIYVYRFLIRYIMRYRKKACKLLITLSEGSVGGNFDETCDMFLTHVMDHLRKSDIVMQYRKNQVFVFLTDIKEGAVLQVIGNIINSWNEQKEGSLSITYEYDFVKFDENPVTEDNEPPRVAVVDDDSSNLKLAGHILSKYNIRVTALRSGEALLEFLKNNKPDLILLDIKMPGMDGFETMEKLKAMDEDIADIPVAFLTADENAESEKRGVELGAVDFIKKPFIPEVLVMRVKSILSK